MLIVFDLDDTLIDTSGSITPFKLRECLRRLVEDGMEVVDFEKTYLELLTLSNTLPSSKEALAKLIWKMGFSPEKALKSFAELTTPLPVDFRIPMTPDAVDVIYHFRAICPITLVTGGHPPFQMEKIEKAGLDTSIFSKIAIPEDSVKLPVYEAIIKEFSVTPGEVWVCGDRIETDLVPARELGFHTVHMKWGRGKMGSADWIEHTIHDLSGLKEVIK